MDKIPVDKNGRPLKLCQIVQGVISNGAGPPKFVTGKLVVFSGPDKSLVETSEGRSYVVENKTIEIRID